MTSQCSNRDRNIKIFTDTLNKIIASDALTASVNASIASQKFYNETERVDYLVDDKYDATANVIVSSKSSFDAARNYTADKVCVLNFASATNPGGGVVHGSNAQEECLCRCSTLYLCLNTSEAGNKFYTPHRHECNALHNDDVIYTPDVKIIKEDNYSDLDEYFTCDVLTCAAPNLRDTPTNLYNSGEGEKVDISNEELFNLHVKRARKILTIAAMHNAEVLILGAFGCGAFRNDPQIVAEAYKTVLPEFAKKFKTIEFAVFCKGDMTNYETFKKVLA